MSSHLLLLAFLLVVSAMLLLRTPTDAAVELRCDDDRTANGVVGKKPLLCSAVAVAVLLEKVRFAAADGRSGGVKESDEADDKVSVLAKGIRSAL